MSALWRAAGLCADTAGGVYQLARLGVVTGFRFRGEYWAWRMQTAFGRGLPAGKRELARSVLDYGRWMHRVRRAR